jgi:hypothetical protein
VTGRPNLKLYIGGEPPLIPSILDVCDVVITTDCQFEPDEECSCGAPLEWHPRVDVASDELPPD